LFLKYLVDFLRWNFPSQRRFSTLLTDVLASTKICFLTSVSTKKILDSKLSGTSSPHHIERDHVMAYAVSKEVSCKSRPPEAI
jgi:hypothetical protein